MRVIEPIWDYVNLCYEEDGIIPSQRMIEDALDHILTLDDYGYLEHTIEQFISMHRMEGIQNKYEEEKNMNFVFEGEKLQNGDKYIEENGFAYRSKEELIEAIKQNAEEFADVLIEHGIAEFKEVI